MNLILLLKQRCFMPALVLGVLAFNLACLPMASFADTERSVEQRLAVLDFEILLLRTEIALRNGERGRFLINMHELSNQVVPAEFQARWNFLNRELEALAVEQVEQSQFRSARYARDIVLLLPLSSAISDASRVMAEVFEREFSGRRVHLIDTDLYEDVQALWALVKLFNPGLIIGPLEKHKAEPFYALDPQIPAISFTPLATHLPYVRALASNSFSQIQYLAPILDRLDVTRIAWLTDRSAQANQLMQDVEAFYQQRGVSGALIERFYLEQGVDRSVSAMLGVNQSVVRQNWLHSTLGRTIETAPYVRADKRLVIGVMPQSSALQIKPLLDFYQRTSPFLWIPTQSPSVEHFRNRQSSWQSTYALFPAHLTQKWVSLADQDNLNSEVGLFRALAKALVKLVETAEQPLPYSVTTEMGEMSVNAVGHYQFLPSLILLDKGQLTPVALEKIYITP
ncbi:type 1 periplasmic-binding domain-containing protein [Thiomicrospira microaerophila]|uniref:hypothetical protein n=1 Tax=Thiomicrospira microaerophila TaxID=406020 RepID=UPI0005C8E7A2|nr:hypothetical protein [Thiomicrospira microaerophila]